MKNTVIVIAILSVFLSQVALAQTTAVPVPTAATSTPVTTPMPVTTPVLTETPTATTTPVQTEGERREVLEGKRQHFREKIEAARAELEERQEKFKAEIEAKRAERGEKLDTRRAELKAKLERITDERRQRIVEGLYDKINNLNERLTGKFLNSLLRLENALDKVTSRADKAEANGADVSDVRDAIATASGVIEDGKMLIETQSAKVYDFEVDAEERLGPIISEARNALHDNLRILREAIVTAHSAVKDAARLLSSIPRVDEFEVDDESEDESGEVEDEGSDDNSQEE